jgi:hypothetical protein
MESIGLPGSETPEIGERGSRRAFSPAVAGSGPHVLLVVGMRGLFPRGPAANKEYSFILLHTSADKRSGGVSGALRGGQGRETGRGARAVDSPLVTALPVLWICSRIPYPESRIPVLQPLVTVFFVSGCWFARARREEPHRNPSADGHLRASRSAPKGRNNEAQAEGLGLDYPKILPPALRGRNRSSPISGSPTTSGTCGIEKDCSAPSGLGYRFGSR